MGRVRPKLPNTFCSLWFCGPSTQTQPTNQETKNTPDGELYRRHKRTAITPATVRTQQQQTTHTNRNANTNTNINVTPANRAPAVPKEQELGQRSVAGEPELQGKFGYATPLPLIVTPKLPFPMPLLTLSYSQWLTFTTFAVTTPDPIVADVPAASIFPGRN